MWVTSAMKSSSSTFFRTMYSCGQVAAYVLANVHCAELTNSCRASGNETEVPIMTFPAFPELADMPTPEAAQHESLSRSFYLFGFLGFQESDEFT